jgi:hypothetical protein
MIPSCDTHRHERARKLERLKIHPCRLSNNHGGRNLPTVRNFQATEQSSK